jgi:hypothetical protein
VISMTEYWQLFKDNVGQFSSIVEDGACQTQIQAANLMADVGINMEALTSDKLKQVPGQLYRISKRFTDNPIQLTKEKAYLPEIYDTNSLLFAILYYKHLDNYENTQFDFSQNKLYFYEKPFVTSSIEGKKQPTADKAELMLKLINQYCNEQGIKLDKKQFQKKEGESSAETIKRIKNIISSLGEPDILPRSIEIDELTRLSTLLKNLNDKKSKKDNTINVFKELVQKYEQAMANYNSLNNQWNQRHPFIQWIYKLIHRVYKLSPLKELDAAKKALEARSNQVNTMISDGLNYTEQLALLEHEVSEIESAIAETEASILIQQKVKQEEEVIETTIEPIKKQIDVVEPMPQEEEETSGVNQAWQFFKDYIPSREVTTAVAVGAAAIVIQNLNYGS